MLLSRPLLAATVDDDNIHLLDEKKMYPMLASPKLDGIRVLVKDGKAYTRSMKLVRNRNVQQNLSKVEFNGLDGEICAGNVLDPMCFRNTTTAVMAEDAVIDFTYWVFDDFLHPGQFKARYEALQERIQSWDIYSQVKVLEHILIENREQLEEYEQENLAKGFEGTMLRSLHGHYKQNRSTFNEGILLKLKRGQLVRGEAVILDFIERMHNTNEATLDERGFTKRSAHKDNKVGRGDLGSLVVRNEEEQEFRIGNGPGLDDALRKEIWDNRDKYRGMTVRYQWFKYGAYDKPRFPQFIAFRDEDDQSEG